MYWSDIVQAVASLVTFGVAGGLVKWMHTIFRERERSMKEKYEGKVELLEERLRLKEEEIALERRAREIQAINKM